MWHTHTSVQTIPFGSNRYVHSRYDLFERDNAPLLYARDYGALC